MRSTRSSQVSHRYCVYGITVCSEFPLSLPKYAHDGNVAQVRFQSAPASYFAAIATGFAFHPSSDCWYEYAFLPDGSSYVRWKEVGQFLVSADGASVTCHRDRKSSRESFQVYLLGQALSFALVKLGFEPLHATTIVVDGKAVAFLGESGVGKSTLAASFLSIGFRSLTDDLLVLRETKEGILAYPGPARIKVFPKVARKFLGSEVGGAPVNSGSAKLILPLGGDRICADAVPLAAIYSIVPPWEVSLERGTRVDILSPRQSFIELVRHTFNYRLVNASRLGRQFSAAAHLSCRVPVRTLSYPRRLTGISKLREAILLDLASSSVAREHAVTPLRGNRGTAEALACA